MICSVRGRWHKSSIPYSGSDQSMSAGHKRAPVLSWLNPRSILTLRAIGGCRYWPRGTIQSRIAPLRAFVSSDLALETPFWSYYIISEYDGNDFSVFIPNLKLPSPLLYRHLEVVLLSLEPFEAEYWTRHALFFVCSCSLSQWLKAGIILNTSPTQPWKTLPVRRLMRQYGEDHLW